MKMVNEERQGATTAAHEARIIACPHEMLRHTLHCHGAVAGRGVNRFKNGINKPVEHFSIPGSQPASVGSCLGSAS